jgi:hypothetical protein
MQPPSFEAGNGPRIRRGNGSGSDWCNLHAALVILQPASAPPAVPYRQGYKTGTKVVSWAINQAESPASSAARSAHTRELD